MKRALISDIHGNFGALSAVLKDIGGQNVAEIMCLGDIVGYGPSPCECLDAIMDNCPITILGNHDQAALFDPEGFNPVALQAIFWTRDEMERGPDRECNDRRWDFLGALPRLHNDGDYLFVHGSPREPTNEYVFPEDVYNQRKMDALFSRIEKYCFQGHTHIPGVFSEDREFLPPEDCNYRYKLTDKKSMVNVGSVGQPRDNDPRACYVVLDDDAGELEFRRVDYDVEKTAQMIYDIPELDNMLGDRLRSGR